MLGQGLVEKSVVGSDESQRAPVFAHYAIEEEFGFLTQGLPQIVVEVTEQDCAGSERVDIAQAQPLPGEIRGEVVRALVGEHAANLPFQFRGLAEFAANRSVEQFIVRDTAP